MDSDPGTVSCFLILHPVKPQAKIPREYPEAGHVHLDFSNIDIWLSQSFLINLVFSWLRRGIALSKYSAEVSLLFCPKFWAESWFVCNVWYFSVMQQVKWASLKNARLIFSIRSIWKHLRNLIYVASGKLLELGRTAKRQRCPHHSVGD